jgi:maltose alpha-D-glucosyltransferase/alpha-amylase
MLNADRRRLELAYSLLLTLPGTPVLRYGDEIGMGDDLDLPERNCARTPMQWSTGGFTTSDTPCSPVISGGVYGYQHINVAEQRRDPDSFLNWTERVCRMRKEMPEVGWGDFKVIDCGDPAVLILRYFWRNNAVLFVHNLNAEPREAQFQSEPQEKSGIYSQRGEGKCSQSFFFNESPLCWRFLASQLWPSPVPAESRVRPA